MFVHTGDEVGAAGWAGLSKNTLWKTRIGKSVYGAGRRRLRAANATLRRDDNKESGRCQQWLTQWRGRAGRGCRWGWPAAPARTSAGP